MSYLDTSDKLSKEEKEALSELAEHRVITNQRDFMGRVAFKIITKKVAGRYKFLNKAFLRNLLEDVDLMSDEEFSSKEKYLNSMLDFINKTEEIHRCLLAMKD